MPTRLLTWDEAEEARARYRDEDERPTMEALAVEYGIAEFAMWNILHDITYKYPQPSMDDYPGIAYRRTLNVAQNGVYHGNGKSLSWWLRRRGCDQRDINRITARRFRYGSYRPSDRAALMLDASPELTPYALDIAAD